MNTGRYTTGPHQPGGRRRGPNAGWKWMPTVMKGVAGLTTNPNPVHGLKTTRTPNVVGRAKKTVGPIQGR